ncbi:glycosyltransferase 36 [Alkaliphilus metalliredigens QYMF]|uniref:Glycosyltransferase 36 n=1 Tax=Alkaliphilus metalliredigens (strain QYMF) TaxID=293826 RepID=A6TTZ5_ALKMQ|nr:glucoamylase family protein [Alkaliphilus metalliredigens]ABR49663.1 glycosyltransferase 36 [Alkaliphilus metalliredigens QYMF]
MFRSGNRYESDKIVHVQDVLLTPEELQEHAKEAAKIHTTSRNTQSLKYLLKKVDHNFESIASVYNSLNKATKNKQDLSPASEWLLDNFYKVEEQVKEARQNLAKERFLKLQTLDSGYLEGYPRIYGVALEFISHTDGKLDETLLMNFIRAYQSQRVLTIAEIWALSLMIRIALIENIRIICGKIHKNQVQWQKAEETAALQGDDIIKAIKENIELKGRVNFSYIEHLLKIVRREDVDTGEMISYLEMKLEDFNTSIKNLVEEEHKEQASRKIAIGNSITSLNVVATIDWNDIFENLSLVEEVLRRDPSQVYMQLDFDSRDYYRSQIERIANKLKESETRVARKAIKCAQEAEALEENHMGDKKKHVGYYLIDKGRKKLFDYLGHKDVKDTFHQQPLSTYLTPITIITAFIVLMAVMYTQQFVGIEGVGIAILVVLVTFIPATDVAIALTNWFLTHTFRPMFLPRVEYREGLHEEVTTMVVVPTLLPDPERATTLIRQLEVFYLANKESHLYFALAGDYGDGDAVDLPEDKKTIETALLEIKTLNEKYGKEIFYFFHRKRQFCEKQKKWMGWERKRGALMELNELIRGSNETSYTIVSGDINRLKKTKYMLTIDADTQLSIDTAKKLIGIASHPLHKPIIDEEKGIVVEGYGLIQPRIGISIESSSKSFFTRVFGGQGGIDSYTIANSDVYQDLYGTGIFSGKGIYDIDVFQRTLGETIPDHSILSHDLLEGSYVRTGLATDLELIDHFPSKYSAYIMRLHRWVRGDWQLTPWLFSTVKNRRNETIKNPLPALVKWQILDNMRRSISPISILLLFSFGLTIFPGAGLFWIVLGLLAIGIPLLISFFDYIKQRHYKAINERLNADMIVGVKATFYQVLLMLIFLPYQAYMMADAIIRTLHRVFISKENLLEWVTAADVEKSLGNNLEGSIKRMHSSIGIVVILLLAVIFINPYHLIYATIIAMLWGIGPWVAFYISRETEKKIEDVNQEEMQQLRKIARKTWAYYEDFSDEENNYLPPDNYQMYPPNEVAHRTSPTNIGFLLMSILSARDFGYVTTGEMIERFDKTIATVERMDMWRGHLYNWYDTRTLEVLRPYYISTVDSGNFISYLITVKEGLSEYIKKPILDIKFIEGMKDTMLLTDEYENVDIQLLKDLSGAENISLREFSELIRGLNREGAIGETEEKGWKRRLFDMIHSFEKEIEHFFPSLETLKELDVLHVEKYNYSLLELKEMYHGLISGLDKKDGNAFLQKELMAKKQHVEKTMGKMKEIINRIEKIIETAEFRHLYDTKRHLFSIGYNVDEERLTNSYYDLLASEVRTTSYLAIARKEVPKKHWFKLGRAMAIVNGHRGLVSWTGTMFEYFMPYLVMKNYDNTLMDESYATTIKAQQMYCDKKNVPWGISESGYYTFDLALNYQYKAFGIPDIGLKRGLGKDLVVSPYSTFLALSYAPRETMKNIQRLIKEGLEGTYGFYEAIDYTPRSISSDEKPQVVKSFMAHHQGMTFIAIANYLHKNLMQKRFHADPVVQAGEILLQERIPVRLIITKQYKEDIEPVKVDRGYEKVLRTYGVPEGPVPQCHLLSNGRYSVMLSNAGTGYSKMEDLQITRWRQDALTGQYGTHIFIHHLNANKTWTTAYEPIKQEPDGYKVIFSQEKAEFLRTDENIDTHTEIVVSPENDVEIRRVTLRNHGQKDANIEVTSYFEAVIAPQAADLAHPAFSNLFVRTEVIDEYDSLIASRRPREHGQAEKWIFHTVTVDGETSGGLQYETNRKAFIGRGRNISNAIALEQPLTGTKGIILDPIMSLRKTIKVAAGKSVTVSFITGIDETKEKVIKLVKKYHDASSIERSFQLAITRSQVESSYLNLKSTEIKIYQEMISQILFLSPIRRKNEMLLKKNKKSQSGLWAYGISGDIPIVILKMKRMEDIDYVSQLLKAHEYWRSIGLKVDLVILNEDESNYLQPLQQLINEVVSSSQERHMVDQPGGIFIRNGDVIPEEDKILLCTVAKLILDPALGSISKQMVIQEEDIKTIEDTKKFNKGTIQYISENEEIDVDYFNGYGGFSKDGREYIIRLKENVHTPAPWINVVANEKLGFIVTEGGSSFTWAENSRENKLTPWSNDPVSDPSGEVIYMRDEDTGEIWSMTPLPIREKENYTITHGAGYSKFKHHSHGILQELTLFVPAEDPIKINLVKLKNTGGTKRKLTVTYYLKPVLGVNDEVTQQYIITEKEESPGGILIRNPYNSDFPGRIAFAATSENMYSYTCDRQEFIGMQGSLSKPMGLGRERLGNKTGAGYDPCVAIQISLELDENEEKEFVFLFGQGQNIEEVHSMINAYQDLNNSKFALQEIKDYWHRLLGTVKVKTPDLSMDLLLNQWLQYQTIACRLWARSAFYQSGGAYGFRDQLQDAMNAVYTFPEATRQQILLNCRHQFIEGDVQHWWHPGAGDKGIRTRFSDDLLWLPFAVIEYIHNTGDYEILHQEETFLEEEPLKEHEDERYGIPRVSQEKASVYQHCIRAIERGLQFGENGIPLMGSGDWNDGMNTVGNKGKGESVWLGWFMYSILTRFSELCNRMAEEDRGKRYLESAKSIAESIEKNAWDGGWYIRAFYDNGAPLGSSQNTECKIDSLAQSWSIISKGGREDRSQRAMKSVEQYLIKKDEGLILLFTPPFDKSEQEPGYIKGYVPGVRENGGQYTHAATWVIKAFAMTGEGDKAWELFNLINPINHTRTPLEAATYKLEPYVMAADVYAVSPHVGRGGWSWYTGVSGWMYKVGIEDILGLKKNGDRLFIDPCIPKDWKEYSMKYRYQDTDYHIVVKNPNGASSQVKELQMDGKRLQEAYISLINDKVAHRVEVIM